MGMEKYLMEQIAKIETIYAKDDNRFGGYSKTEYFNHTAPEDYCKERTSWDDLRENADDMYYMLSEIKGIISQMKDEIELEM